MTRNRRKKASNATTPPAAANQLTATAPNFERIERINRIFFSKGWLDRNDFSGRAEHALNCCCRISALLNNQQFDLFCLLLSEFRQIRSENYSPAFSRALEQMPLPAHNGHVFHVAPVIAPDDLKKVKTKSGPSLIYTFKNEIWRWSRKFKDYRLYDHQFPSEMSQVSNNGQPFTTIFIDDFIGTGDTVGRFLDDYENGTKKPNEEIVFMSVAIMQRGLNSINNRGLNVYYDTLLSRGIADCPDISDKDAAYQIMDTIESLLDVEEGYKYGYGGSECLVSLVNTPNNTFPVFWKRKAKGGGAWPAPFPRA